MSHGDVLPGGQGWGVRERREPEAKPRPRALTDAEPGAPAAALATAVNPDGTWIAGVGWVAADHPYATGEQRKPKPRRRKRALFGLLPSGIVARLVVGLGFSAAAGLVGFSTFGGHSWITNFLHGTHNVTTPATIAGDPLVSVGPLADLTRQTDTYLKSQPIVTAFGGGFYAPPGASVPSYGVFAFQHSGSSMTSGTMSDIVGEIAGGTYEGTVKTDTVNAVTYTCGNVALGVRTGVACIWDDYDVAGFLVSFSSSDVDSTMVLTRLARNAIESPPPTPAPTATSTKP